MTRSPTRTKARPPAPKAAGQEQSQLLVGRLAQKYGVAANRLMATLRDSVFAPGKGEAPFSDTEVASALILSEKYGLDPFSKQIYLTRAKGKLLVIVPIDGWIKLINEQPTFDGMEFTYTDNEDGSPHSCTCRIYDSRRSHPVEVTEYFEECYREGNYPGPWQTHGRRMLRHKAVIQAGRYAYGFAGVMDEDEAEGMRTPDYTVVEEPTTQIPPPNRKPATMVTETVAPDDHDTHVAATKEAEVDMKAQAFDEWKHLQMSLNDQQFAECVGAAGGNDVTDKSNLDAINAAIDMAKQQLAAKK